MSSSHVIVFGEDSALTIPRLISTSCAGAPRSPAATCRRRPRICSHASLTAPPLRSEPELAAVAEVSAADLVRIVAYDDAQTVAAATLKLAIRG